MLLAAAREFNINLECSWMIGDSERDLLAGKNAGCKTIYISDIRSNNADFYAENLQTAVNIIMGGNI